MGLKAQVPTVVPIDKPIITKAKCSTGHNFFINMDIVNTSKCSTVHSSIEV